MASALKRGCRFIVILFALLLAVAVGAGLWLWQGHRGFADAPIGGTAAGATVESELLSAGHDIGTADLELAKAYKERVIG